MEQKFTFLKKLEEYKKQQEEQKNQEELKEQNQENQNTNQEICEENKVRYDLMMTHKLRRYINSVILLNPTDKYRIRYYLRKNASPNVINRLGRPLWEIVMMNMDINNEDDYELFVQLLNSGLNLDSTNKSNETPLMCAIRLKDKGVIKSDIVELLEERKINDLQEHQTQNEENEYKF